MVREALEAANILKLQGIHAEVIDCYSIKPFPEVNFIVLDQTNRLLCCCKKNTDKIGGLYGAVTECVSRLYPVPVRYVAIEDHWGQSGTVEELREYYGLTHREIVHNAVQVLAMRRR
jgi:Transketolase, C-terminal subunit